MTNRILITIFALGTLFISCKDEKKQADNITEADSTKTKNLDIYTSDQYIIASKGYIRVEANDNSAKIDSLDFGKSIKIKMAYYDEEGNDEGYLPGENERKNGYVAVYKTTPKTSSEKPYGYVKEEILVDEYDFKKYKMYFSYPEYMKLTSAQKRIIIDNGYHEGRSYSISQNAAKANESIVYGDFDKDGIKDVAITLENLENTYGMILVILNNKATKQPYIAYKKSFTDYLSIRKVKAGGSVQYEDGETDEGVSNIAVYTFENDGVEILANAQPFYSIQYSNQTHKFLEHNL